MKILMLSWEFPPKIVGGIARHVHDLSLALVKQGHHVHVITCGVPGLSDHEMMHGVTVHRVSMDNPSTPDFITWVMQLNINMVGMAASLIGEGLTFDLIHSHDWLASYAGKALKDAWHLPLVATIHATEYGRNNGLHSDLQRYISNVEWWLGYESWRVICCSKYMWHELQRVFQMPGDKLRIIPNGVYPEIFQVNLDVHEIRRRYAADDEKIVFHVGRIVREKGLGVLIETIPHVLHHCSQTKFIIAGKGPYEEELKMRCRELGVYDRVFFTGYIDDMTRNALFRSADVAVFPSLYEPFGIVAIEGMAARVPVVVTDTGGMSEIIHHGVNGLKAFTDNPYSLGDNILWILNHPEHAKQMMENAWKDVQEIYNWDVIADETAKVYEEVLHEYSNSSWRSIKGEESSREQTMAELVRTVDEDMSRYREIH
jgi:glycogen(starch) synthase